MVTAPIAPSGVRRIEGAVVFLLLLVVAYVTFERTFDMRPLGADNLYVLSWAKRAPASSLLRVDPTVYPEWRPLTYASIWLQYRWSGISDMALYQGVNLLIWTLCGWFIYRIVARVADAPIAGLLAAIVVLIDVRAITAQTLIVERQSPLAALCGLGALWILARSRGPRLSRWETTGVLLACLAAALSKEYGMAFAAAFALYGILERRLDLVLAGGVAAASYAALRLGFAGGANAVYCEYMGYFFVVRKVCYDGLDATGLKQMAYNVSATGIGTMIPGLFTADGTLGLAPMRLAVSAVWLGAAWLGWRRGPAFVRAAALVIVFNTAISFMSYGIRNQIIGIVAMGILVGVGLAVAERLVRSTPARAWMPAVAVGMILLFVGAQIVLTRRDVDGQVRDFLSQEPCQEFLHADRGDPELIRQIKVKYGMPNPDCVPGR